MIPVIYYFIVILGSEFKFDRNPKETCNIVYTIPMSFLLDVLFTYSEFTKE